LGWVLDESDLTSFLHLMFVISFC